MITSDITNPYQQPMSTLAKVKYTIKSDAFLAADLAANNATYSDSTRKAADTSRYEFPGDATYAAYSSRGGY
jgi:hypothetical protein